MDLTSNFSTQRPVPVRPYINARPSVSAVSIKILVLLCIQMAMLAVSGSIGAFTVAAAAAAGSAAAASLCCLVRGRPWFTVIPAVAQGIMTGLLLPESYPPAAAMLITAGTFLLVRILFPDSDMPWMNMAALAVVLAWFSGRTFFPEFQITRELLPSRNPSLELIRGGVFPVHEFDSPVTVLLNSSILSGLKASVPEGYISMLWDNGSVIPAFRFNIITILSSVVLFADDSLGAAVPAVFTAVYASLVRILAPFMFGGSLNSGDVFLAVFTGGTLFCAVFMIQWFGTVPATKCGKIIYAAAGGATAFLVAGCGTSPVGMVYTVLLCNLLSLVIHHAEESRLLGRTAGGERQKLKAEIR